MTGFTKKRARDKYFFRTIMTDLTVMCRKLSKLTN
jgi:hypothetical protein